MTKDILMQSWDNINLLLEEANKKGAFTLLQSKTAADALSDLYPLIKEKFDEMEQQENDMDWKVK